MEQLNLPSPSQGQSALSPKSHLMSHEVREKITSNLRYFDLYALIELLQYYGYDHSSIRIEGHMGFESQPGLIKSIRFEPTDHRVTLGLYMGLGSANGYLPSYFFNMVDNDTFDESHFQDLIGFFDQRLLKMWLNALMPQSFIKVSRSHWIRTMASFTSLAHLQHLFELIFPELQVRCERLEIDHAVASKPCVLGTSKIGLEMILGDQFRIIGYAHRITLIADHEEVGPDQPWHICAKDRLQRHVFPLISNLDLFIEVILLIRGSKQWLSLDQGKMTLGFERFKGQEDHLKRIGLHYGPVTIHD